MAKSTSLARALLLVVEPHSRSMVPLTSSGIRLADVTACQPTSSPGLPVCFFTSARMALLRSTEKPTGWSAPAR